MNDLYEIVIGVVTIVVLGITIYNSYWLRREIKLSHKPILVFAVQDRKGELDMRVENIGEGPATNINVKIIPSEKNPHMPKLGFELEGLGVNATIFFPFIKSIESNNNDISLDYCISGSYHDTFNEKFEINENREFAKKTKQL